MSKSKSHELALLFQGRLQDFWKGGSDGGGGGRGFVVFNSFFENIP